MIFKTQIMCVWYVIKWKKNRYITTECSYLGLPLVLKKNEKDVERGKKTKEN